MKNKILKTIAYIMAAVFTMSVLLIDSDIIIIDISAIISGSWLCLFALANMDRLERYNGE